MIKSATHKFDMLDGYITEYTLMKNCCETSNHGSGASPIDNERAQNQAATNQQEETESEEEKQDDIAKELCEGIKKYYES